MSWLLKLLWFRLSFGCLFPLYMGDGGGDDGADDDGGDDGFADEGFDDSGWDAWGGYAGDPFGGLGPDAFAPADYGFETAGASGGISELGFGGGAIPVAALPGYTGPQARAGEQALSDAIALSKGEYYSEEFDDVTGWAEYGPEAGAMADVIAGKESQGALSKTFEFASDFFGVDPSLVSVAAQAGLGMAFGPAGAVVGQMVGGVYDVAQRNAAVTEAYDYFGTEQQTYTSDIAPDFSGFEGSTQEDAVEFAKARTKEAIEAEIKARESGIAKGKVDLESYLAGYEGYESYKETMGAMKTRGTWSPGAAESVLAEMGKFEEQRDVARAAIEENKYVQFGDLQKRGESRSAEKQKKAPGTASKGAVRGQLGQVAPNLGKTNFRQPTLLSGVS